MPKGTIALDADGVLLDYGLAYAGAWERAFGGRPAERDPTAYWPVDRWDVIRLEGNDELATFRAAFDEEFWASIPPVAGAVEACAALAEAGYDLVCVTALPDEFRAARQRNLRAHGFPIDVVHATDNVLTAASPKADTLNALAPVPLSTTICLTSLALLQPSTERWSYANQPARRIQVSCWSMSTQST